MSDTETKKTESEIAATEAPVSDSAAKPAEGEVNNPAPSSEKSEETKPAEKSEEKKASNAPVRKKSKEIRSEAKRVLKEAEVLYKAGKGKIAKEVESEFVVALTRLKNSIESEEGVDTQALEKVKSVSAGALAPFKKSAMREVMESLLFALLFALILRTFFIEPFKIPTRSMVPTLLEGDQLFVTKLSYGIRLPFLDKYIAHFSEPQRGDVVVFAFPQKEAAMHLASTNSQCMKPEQLAGEKDYIKRIIGVEGDTIEVIQQTVLVNGEPIMQLPFYEHTVSDKFFFGDKRKGYWNTEKHGEAEYTTMTHDMPTNHFGPITVEPGHVFCMGDNRDNSLDSRCWGQVPVDNIKGRAQIIWWSGGSNGPRWNRMFQTIH